MNLNATIGSKISTLRKQHGLTQEQLAEKLDISIKHCSAVERGLSCLSLEKLIEVSTILDVSLDFLVKDTSSSNKSFDCFCDKFPPSIVNIIRSEDENEVNLLREYLCMYSKLRGKGL